MVPIKCAIKLMEVLMNLEELIEFSYSDKVKESDIEWQRLRK